MGIAGSSAVTRKSVLNAEPSMDLGFRGESFPALRACVVTPLVESDALVAVLALYSKTVNGFTEDHLRLLEILGPRLASALVDAAIADEDSRLVPADVPRHVETRAQQLIAGVVRLETDTTTDRIPPGGG